LSLAVRKGQQSPWIVPDELWARIEPLLPVVPRRADHPGRRRLDDGKVLCGILFVLYTGIPWEFLPQELGFGPRPARRPSRPAKGSVFCLPQHLESYAADVFGRLAAAERLRGLARDPFITALAGSSLTSTPCTRSARATAAPSGRSSPSSPMTPGITSPGCAWTLTATWPPALPPTTATWPGSGKCPEISASG
jgi:transposase